MNIVLKSYDVCKMDDRIIKCDSTFENGLIGHLSSVIGE